MLWQQSDGFESLKSEKKLFEAGLRLIGRDKVDAAAEDRPANVNEMTRSLCYLMLENVCSSTFSYLL